MICMSLGSGLSDNLPLNIRAKQCLRPQGNDSISDRFMKGRFYTLPGAAYREPVQAMCHKGVHVPGRVEAHITPWFKCLCASMKWAPFWQVPPGVLKWGSSHMSECSQKQGDICHQSPCPAMECLGCLGCRDHAGVDVPHSHPWSLESQGSGERAKGNTEDPRRVWPPGVQYQPSCWLCVDLGTLLLCGAL